MRTAPSAPVAVSFRVKDADGKLVDADSLPTAKIFIDGYEASVVPAVTSVTGTGKYRAAWANDPYTTGSLLQLEISAAVGGETFVAVVWEAVIDSAAATAAEVTAAKDEIIAWGDTYWEETFDVADIVAALLVDPANRIATDASGNVTIAQAFPANFSQLGITAAGHLSRVVLVDTTTTNTDMRGTNSAALAAQWTSTRAAYLDNLNIGGNVASQSDVQAITQASRVRLAVPPQMQRPASGSTAYRLWIYNYDELHQANDLDSFPVVTAEDHTGADLSTGLGTVTKQSLSTGIYYVDYTVGSTDSPGGLIFKVDATEEAVTTQYVATTVVVDSMAVDFTSSDRSKLEAVFGKLPTAAYLLGGSAGDGSGYSTHSASDAADAVRTELAPELALVDVAVSSRGTFSATAGATAGFEHFFGVSTPLSTMNDVGATSAGATPVKITVLDESAVPVQSAKVNIQDSSGGPLGFYGHTNSSGVVMFYLDDGSYQAAITAMSGFNSHAPQAFTVSAGEIVSGAVPVQLEFVRTAPVVADDPALCLVKCFITDAGGQPVEGITISATPKSRSLTVPSKIVTLIAATAETDATGYAELLLPRADAIDSEGSKAYRFQIRNNGMGIYDLIEKEIPNTGETTLDVIVNS